MRRVVVTGLGIVCPLGNSVEEAWKNALAGKSGVRKIQSFDASEYSCQIAGETVSYTHLTLPTKA